MSATDTRPDCRPRPRADSFEAVFPLALRVLVVDDQADAADSLAALMEVCGAEVAVCYDGAAGLAAAAELRPQVALLDLCMPGVDGCELARRLRAMAGGGPLLLVAVTGADTEESRARAAAAGFDLYYTKPVDPVALVHTLANFHWRLTGGEARD